MRQGSWVREAYHSALHVINREGRVKVLALSALERKRLMRFSNPLKGKERTAYRTRIYNRMFREIISGTPSVPELAPGKDGTQPLPLQAEKSEDLFPGEKKEPVALFGG